MKNTLTTTSARRTPGLQARRRDSRLTPSTRSTTCAACRTSSSLTSSTPSVAMALRTSSYLPCRSSQRGDSGMREHGQRPAPVLRRVFGDVGGGDGQPKMNMPRQNPRRRVQFVATVSVRYIVYDVDAAIDFYCRNLGFTEVMHPAPAFAMLARGDLRLVLSAAGGGPGGGAAGARRAFPQRDRHRRGRQPDPAGGPVRQPGGALRADPARGQAVPAILSRPGSGGSKGALRSSHW